jgi:hypothetical protein
VLEIDEAAVRAVADPAVVFMNVNTPDELAQAHVIAAAMAAS